MIRFLYLTDEGWSEEEAVDPDQRLAKLREQDGHAEMLWTCPDQPRLKRALDAHPRFPGVVGASANY